MVEAEIRQPVEPRLDSAKGSFDPSERGFEQRLLQSELVFSRETTLREVLNRKTPYEVLYKDETDRVGLLDFPINFQIRDIGDSLVYIVPFSTDEVGFSGSRFVDLLNEAKPIVKDRRERFQQNRDGITADWIIMQERGREVSSLYQDHIAPESIISRHFEEFGTNHFSQFWHAVSTYSRDNKLWYLNFHSDRLISEEKALAMYGLDFLRDDFERFLKIIYCSQFRDEFAQFLKKETNIDIVDDFGPVLSFRPSYTSVLFENFTAEMKKKLTTDFYNQLEDDKKEKKLAYRARSSSEFPSEAIFVDKDGNPYDIREDGIIRSEIKGISRTSDDQIEIREGDSYMRVAFVLDKTTGRREKRLVGLHIPVQEDEITPIVVWKKDKATGRREYFCGKVSDDLIQAFPDMFSQRHDTLGGQIVVAAYSDDLKHILPTKLPLVKGGKKQPMMEAQMPVFVPLFSRAYLNMSPMISGFEGMGPIVRIK